MEWPDGSRLDPQIPQIGQRLRLSSRTQYLREKAGCGISTWEHPRSHCIHWQAIDCVSRTASTFWSIFLLSLRTICRSFNVWIAEMGMSRRHKLSKPSTKSCWDNLEAAKWHHSDIWTCWNLLNPQFSSMISQRTKPPFVGELSQPCLITEGYCTPNDLYIVVRSRLQTFIPKRTNQPWHFGLHFNSIGKFPNLTQEMFQHYITLIKPSLMEEQSLRCLCTSPKIPKCLQLSRSPFSSTSKKSKSRECCQRRPNPAGVCGKRLSSTISISSRVNMPLLSSPRLSFKTKSKSPKPGGFFAVLRPVMTSPCQDVWRSPAIQEWPLQEIWFSDRTYKNLFSKMSDTGVDLIQKNNENHVRCNGISGYLSWPWWVLYFGTSLMFFIFPGGSLNPF